MLANLVEPICRASARERGNMAGYKTLRVIARRLSWKSPATVLRRHKMDQFPMYPDYTQRGQIWVTTDALIEEWEQKKAELNQGMRLRHPPYERRHNPPYRPYNYRLRNKNRTGTETGYPKIKGEKKRPLHEELGWDDLDLTTKAWIKNHEMTTEEVEEIKKYEAKKRSERTDQPEGEETKQELQEAPPQPRITNPIAEASRRVANRHFERRKRS